VTKTRPEPRSEWEWLVAPRLATAVALTGVASLLRTAVAALLTTITALLTVCESETESQPSSERARREVETHIVRRPCWLEGTSCSLAAVRRSAAEEEDRD
jgi:hypothetical protein